MALESAPCQMLRNGETLALTLSGTFLLREGCICQTCSAMASGTFERSQIFHPSKLPLVRTGNVRCARTVKTQRPVIGKWPESFSNARSQLIQTDFRRRLLIGLSKRLQCRASWATFPLQALK